MLSSGGATISVELESSIYTFIGSTETDGAGSFLIEQLPVGNYQVTVSADGYTDYIVTGIAITSGLPYWNLGVIPL